jgi:hypothetical protein
MRPRLNRIERIQRIQEMEKDIDKRLLLRSDLLSVSRLYFWTRFHPMLDAEQKEHFTFREGKPE